MSRSRADFLSWGVLCVSVLTLVGCTGFPPTQDDQTRSLQEIGPTKIVFPQHFPELSGSEGRIDQVDPRYFLNMVSVCVIGAPDSESNSRYQQMLSFSAEGKTDSVNAVLKNLSARGVVTLGSGVAVTGDGYVITAAHAVQQPEILVRHMLFQCVRARLVFSDAEADFALLKCELETARFLEIRSDALSLGMILFSGGWSNQSGGGRLLEAQDYRSNTGRTYRKLRSSIPLLPGDSGSAVIDGSGRLVGVTISSVYGRLWRKTPASDAVMLDAPELRRLIEQDRARQQK